MFRFFLKNHESKAIINSYQYLAVMRKYNFDDFLTLNCFPIAINRHYGTVLVIVLMQLSYSPCARARVCVCVCFLPIHSVL